MAKVAKRRNRWVADFRDPRTGKRHWISKATRKDAEAALTEALARVQAGQYQGQREAVRFEELAESFMQSVTPTVRESTSADYQSVIDNHLLPAFQGWRVRDITLRQIEQFRADMLAKDVRVAGGKARKIAARTINKCLVLLSMMFNHALRHRWVSHNAAALAKRVRAAAPTEALIEANVLNPDEIKALLDACDDDMRPIVMAAIYTGLRQGELLGLQWGDVELNTGKLHVRRAFTFGDFREPKTRAGRRVVDMPATLVAELKRWKLACPKGELDLVFPNSAGKPRESAKPGAARFLPGPSPSRSTQDPLSRPAAHVRQPDAPQPRADHARPGCARAREPGHHAFRVRAHDPDRGRRRSAAPGGADRVWW
jgi:integrase